jgi:serine/threonine-protein kinase HipA
MRRAEVYYDDVLSGILTETDEGLFIFQYDEDYITKYPDQFITFSMPVSNKMYRDKRLFAFFEGLIPEGWLLDIASKNWKIHSNDQMGLLLACCQNCIGAVSIKPLLIDDEDE